MLAHPSFANKEPPLLHSCFSSNELLLAHSRFLNDDTCCYHIPVNRIKKSC
ncbi:hypothetical protein RchiOBHm_Chr5g0038551 [Rosa chinensis]|uniref:Uncharacterized protein n=1 Tax=Rosa chinensis TaxID=74649 RepID=A0A2P6QC06_ROSCH|nr:hypothetical protein RchiOBHm_Chr5g0038551 [Rosa chinensis]